MYIYIIHIYIYYLYIYIIYIYIYTMADLKSGCRLSHPEKHAKVSWDYHIDLWLRRNKNESGWTCPTSLECP